MSTQRIVSLVFVLLYSTQVYANRPLTTDDAGTADIGSYEVEIGYDIVGERDGLNCKTAGFCLKHGITEKLDFSIAVPYEIDPEDGLGRVAFCIKFALISEKPKLPALSLTYSPEPGGDGYILNSILSIDMGAFIMHINFGYIVAEIVNKKGALRYSSAIELPCNETVTLVGEISREICADIDVENHIEGIFGGSLHIFEAIHFDLGMGVVFHDSKPEYITTSGMTYSF